LQYGLAAEHAYEFLPYSNNYLLKPNNAKEDAPTEEELKGSKLPYETSAQGINHMKKNASGTRGGNSNWEEYIVVVFLHE